MAEKIEQPVREPTRAECLGAAKALRAGMWMVWPSLAGLLAAAAALVMIQAHAAAALLLAPFVTTIFVGIARISNVRCPKCGETYMPVVLGSDLPLKGPCRSCGFDVWQVVDSE